MNDQQLSFAIGVMAGIILGMFIAKLIE